MVQSEILEELVELKKKIVLDDSIDTDRQSAMLHQILTMIKYAQMTDAEYQQYMYPSY